MLADSAEQAGPRLAAGFRKRHPGVHIRIRETDLTDPTTGLRTGLVDVALTPAPFDDTGITTVDGASLGANIEVHRQTAG